MTSKYSVAQALTLAQDPRTPLEILAQIASDHPETWPHIAANPSTYPELRDWVILQIGHTTPPLSAGVPSSSPHPESARTQSAVTPSNRGRATRPKPLLPRSIWAVPIAAIALVAASYLIIGVVVAPQGSIEARALDHDAPVTWSTFVTPEGIDSQCLDLSTGDVGQNLSSVLVQPKTDLSGCPLEQVQQVSTLSLLNTETGDVVWQTDLEEELEWSSGERKQLEVVPGLNEILVRFVNPQNGNSAIVPFSRLTGDVTDPAVAASGQLGPPHLPDLALMSVPGDIKNILTKAPNTDGTYRYSFYRARDMTAPEWTYESPLSPVGGTPFVGGKLILGADSGDVAEAVSLDDGASAPWTAPAGGALSIVDGSYIRFVSLGSDPDDIVFDSSNSRAISVHGNNANISVSRISESGSEQWSHEEPSVVLLSRQGLVTPVQNAQFQAMLAHREGDSNVRLSSADGSDSWNNSVVATSATISTGTSDNVWFSLVTSSGEGVPSVLSAFDVNNGEFLYELALDNPTPTLSMLATKSGVLMRSSSDESVSCLESFELRTGRKTYSVPCESSASYQNMGGNWTRSVDVESRVEISSVVGNPQ